MVLHLNKLEFSSPNNALYQVWLKFTYCFWRRCFINFIDVFLLFLNYLPLEKVVALRLNKLESPSPKDALCYVWLKLAPWFWRRCFINFIDVFLLFLNYLPLEKGVALCLTNLNPHHQRMLCATFG